MALRSRVSQFARQPVQPPDEAVVESASAEQVIDTITEEPVAQVEVPRAFGRGTVREPVVEKTTGIEPEPEPEAPKAQIEAPSTPVEVAAPKRRGPKPGTPRPPRAAKPAPAPEPETPVTAAEIRSRIKELETRIKEARARHDEELNALRGLHRKYHDQLFDLTK